MDWKRERDFLMAHFAELNENDIVQRVIVVHNNELVVDGIESEATLPKAPQMRRIEFRLQQIELSHHKYYEVMSTYKLV